MTETTTPADDSILIFVIATVQATSGPRSEAVTWAGSLTAGPGADRHAVMRYVLDTKFPDHLRGGIILFYSAEPLQFTGASPVPVSVGD